MEREATEKAIKSALAEITDKFDFDRNPMEYTEENLQRVNDECARLARRYIESGDVMIGPISGFISIVNAPLDILPFLPLCGMGISESGVYTVMQSGKTLGRVQYRGKPKQDTPGIIFAGVDTIFEPQEAAEKIEIELIYGDESGPLPEDFGKEGSRWNINRK